MRISLPGCFEFRLEGKKKTFGLFDLCIIFEPVRSTMRICLPGCFEFIFGLEGKMETFWIMCLVHDFRAGLSTMRISRPGCFDFIFFLEQPGSTLDVKVKRKLLDYVRCAYQGQYNAGISSELL